MNSANLDYFVIRVTLKNNTNKDVALLANSRTEALAKVMHEFKNYKEVKVLKNSDNPTPNTVLL